MQNHSYHRAKFINSSNAITGFIYDKINIIEKYSNLQIENKSLMEENIRLQNIFNSTYKRTFLPSEIHLDTIRYHQKYHYRSAIIINNQYTKPTNTLTINKGIKDSVYQDQGVINQKGVIGIISNSSNYYATVMSILNENSNVNARLKKSNHFGTVKWNAKSYEIVQLEDIPIQANIKIGDTIITDGKSTIFPEGILIGKIKDFKISNNKYQQINVKLFNDMSNIKYVTIISNLDKIEIKELENN